jgi:hypothetical protein
LDRDVLQRLAKGDTVDGVAVGVGMSAPQMRMQLTKLVADMGAASQAEVAVRVWVLGNQGRTLRRELGV